MFDGDIDQYMIFLIWVYSFILSIVVAWYYLDLQVIHYLTICWYSSTHTWR